MEGFQSAPVHILPSRVIRIVRLLPVLEVSGRWAQAAEFGNFVVMAESEGSTRLIDGKHTKSQRATHHTARGQWSELRKLGSSTRTHLARPRRPPDTVDIGLEMQRNVVIDYGSDSFNIHATRHRIRTHYDSGSIRTNQIRIRTRGDGG